MRTGARPVGKSPARGSARARAFERKKKKKKSPPRGPAAFRPVLAGERACACASAQRRPPQLLPSIGGLAHSSAVPTSPEARALGVGTSRLAERGVSQPEEGWRRTGLGEREKPPSRSEELGHRAGVCRRHASVPHAPRGCGSTLETGAARRRQVDYHSQKAARGCAYCSRQYLRARPSPSSPPLQFAAA